MYLPVNNAVLILLCHHEEGVGLAVGGAVSAEVVNVEPLHHSALRPLVVYVQLQPVSSGTDQNYFIILFIFFISRNVEGSVNP